MSTAFLHAFGAHLPDRVVTNAEIAARLGRTPDWIESASGIRERRWPPGNRVADLRPRRRIVLSARYRCIHARRGSSRGEARRRVFPDRPPSLHAWAWRDARVRPAHSDAGSLFGSCWRPSLRALRDVLVSAAENVGDSGRRVPGSNTAILFGDGAGAPSALRPGAGGFSTAQHWRRPVPRRSGIRLGFTAADERPHGHLQLRGLPCHRRCWRARACGSRRRSSYHQANQNLWYGRQDVPPERFFKRGALRIRPPPQCSLPRRVVTGESAPGPVIFCVRRGFHWRRSRPLDRRLAVRRRVG